jgi:hypothetical protein
LKYSGIWTTWSPTVGNLTAGNGTTVARYRQVGKVVDFTFTFTFGSTTTISGSPNFTLPVTPNVNYIFNTGLLDSGTAWFGSFAVTSGGTCFLDLFFTNGTYLTTAGGTFSSTAPFTWATNDRIVVNGSYEVA